MWTPNVVFENQEHLHGARDAIKGKSDAIVEISVPRCFVDKTRCKKKIRFNRTISLEVNCPHMDFDDFPFDSQYCEFVLQDLELIGGVKNNSLWNESHQAAKGKTLTSTEYDLSITDANANRSGFRVMMTRKYTLYVYTYFVPCGLMVMVSWVSFAVRVEAVPGRSYLQW